MKKIIMGLLLIIFVSPQTVSAGIVAYDNMPNNTYQGGGNWFGQSGSGDFFKLAQAFTPSTTGVVNLVELGAYGIASSNVGVSFYTDNNGVISNFPLWVGVTNNILGSLGSIASMSVNLGPMLTSGTQYWLSVDSSSPVQSFWNRNDQGASGGLITSFNNDAWISGYGDAFAMRVTMVPEPVTLSFLSLGAVIIAKRRRS